MSFFVPSGRSHASTAAGPYARSKSDSNMRAATPSRSSPLFTWSTKPSRSSATTRSSSYYNRRPRDGFIARMLDKIKRALRQLVRYVRKHPFKALFPIVMALVSSGALAGLARSMNLPIPQALMQLVGAGNSVRGGYDAWYGSQERASDSGGLLKGVIKAASAFV